MYPGMAKSAREEGFDDIAEWFETLAKAEKSHAGRFQKMLDAALEGRCASERARAAEPPRAPSFPGSSVAAGVPGGHGVLAALQLRTRLS